MSGGAKNDYWPGFVDALTNVVIAMVFVIVVLAIALSFSAQLLAKRMAAKLAEQEAALGQARIAQQARPSERERPVSGPLVQAPPAPDVPQVDAQAPVRQRIAVAGNEAASRPQGGVRMKPAEQWLQLDYAKGALTLDPEAVRQFSAALAPLRQRLADRPGTRMAVVAVGPEMALSENQRAAFIRAMAVRNLLLEQGIASERIATRIDMQTVNAQASVAVRVEDAP